MITFQPSSIFDIRAHYYVCPVNCVGVMGAGLAKEFAKRYPALDEEYKALCAEGYLKLGILYISQYQYDEDGKSIILFPTKNHWKEFSRYVHIESGIFRLKQLLDEVHKDTKTTVAMPLIGCGLGGLDAEVIMQKLLRYFIHSLDHIIVGTNNWKPKQ